MVAERMTSVERWANPGSNFEVLILQCQIWTSSYQPASIASAVVTMKAQFVIVVCHVQLLSLLGGQTSRGI